MNLSLKSIQKHIYYCGQAANPDRYTYRQCPMSTCHNILLVHGHDPMKHKNEIPDTWFRTVGLFCLQF